MTSEVARVEAQAEAFREGFAHLHREIGRVFVGQPTLIDGVLLAFFCGGHVLIEGPPGLGKTLLVRTLAEALDLGFSRIQCTPDLMPADITGTNVLVESAPGVHAMTFQPGPIFANVVLADEINRATPRTQAAFLEAMQERHVTLFGQTHRLDEPFCVIATQNPIEMEGTFPLPEAQLDRFFFKLTVQNPSIADLLEIVIRTTGPEQPHATPRFGPDAVREMSAIIRHVKVAEPVLRSVLHLVAATHPSSPDAPPLVRQYVRFGASPRAAQSIILAAKATALLAGRYNVAVDDIVRVAEPALTHRVLRNFQADLDHVTAASIVAQVLSPLRSV
ncbi:MAG: AAA family ATPase [Acidobacteria bacterium]|nr:AAA family ATPase [Acidobacteriota bacterium]